MQLALHPFNWIAGGSDMMEVLATTWKFIIREREIELLRNRVYQERFPMGMPETVLDAFTTLMLREADQQSLCGMPNNPPHDDK